MSSVSFYSQLAARNKAIGGLASGLDTDSLVEALTSSTRSKLAKQTQQKTLINWKVSAYRGVASSLRAFQTKHFSLAAGASSLKTNTFFNVFKGSSSSDKVTVKPGSGAQTGSIKIEEIRQIASSQTFTTKQFQKELKGGEVNVAGTDWTGKTLQVALDGTTKTIRLDSLAGATNADIESRLQTLVDNTFGTMSDSSKLITVTAHPASGSNIQLELSSATSKITVKNSADNLGLTVPLGKELSNRISTSDKIGDFFGDTNLVGDTYRISINDTVITLNKDNTLSEMMSKINNSTAGVKMSFSSISESFVFTSKTTGAGDNLRMEDVQGNLLNLLTGARGGNGFTSDLSYTQVNASGTPAWGGLGLSSPPTAEELDGLKNFQFKITVGGESLTVSADVSAYKDELLDPLGTLTPEEAILKSMNTQLEKKFGADSVKLEYDGVNISVKTDIRDKEIKLADGTGKDIQNALGVLGLNAGSLNKAYSLGYDSTIPVNTGNSILSGVVADTEYKMDMTINGTTKTLTVKFSQEELDNLAQKVDESAADWAARKESTVAAKLNAAKRIAFGSTGDAANVNFAVESGNLVLKTGDKFQVSLGQTAGATPGTDDLLQLVTGGATPKNYTGDGTKLQDIGIGSGTVTIQVGSESHNFTYGGSTTLYDLIDQVNSAFGDREILSFKDGKMVIAGGTQDLHFSDSNAGTDGLMKNMFGQGTYTTAGADASYASRFEAGKNAEIMVEGQWIASTSNSFKINGVDFEVTAKTNGPEEITLNVTADPDEVVDKIKTFIEEYNVLIDYLDGLTKEKATAGYAPLTDEQRAEMSEDQIKQWENEAKKGLLKGDSTIRGVLDQLRQSLYTKVDSAGISLFDIGITTQSFNSSSFSNNGKIEMTESGEAKLRQMLEQNPDAVRELFTNEEKGVAWSLDRVIDNAARTDSSNQGTLVALAGTDSLTGNNTSTLSKRLETIERQISNLQIRLENEYNRYWKQFSALETAISKMNSQSSWLSGFGQ